MNSRRPLGLGESSFFVTRVLIKYCILGRVSKVKVFISGANEQKSLVEIGRAVGWASCADACRVEHRYSRIVVIPVVVPQHT